MGRPNKNGPTLPARWKPHVLKDADQRYAVIRAMRKEIKQLQEDANVDSTQGRMLTEHVVFLHTLLSTMETKALSGEEELDIGRFVQLASTLGSLLSKLGLRRQAKRVQSLDAYIEGVKVVKRRKKSRRVE